MTLSHPVVPRQQFHKRLLRKPAQGENFEISFFNLEYYHF